MAKYDFDKLIPRENTQSVKYDLRQKIFDKPDIIPLWVADTDFATPDFIRKSRWFDQKPPIMLWLDCKSLDLNDEKHWLFFINEANVGLNQEITFGEGGGGFMRMNVACSKELLTTALQNIQSAVNNL